MGVRHQFKISLVFLVWLLSISGPAFGGTCKSNFYTNPSDDYAMTFFLYTTLESCLMCSRGGVGTICEGDYKKGDFVYKVKVDSKTVAIHFIKDGKILSTIPASD